VDYYNFLEQKVTILNSVLVLSALAHSLLILNELMASQSHILGNLYKDSTRFLHEPIIPTEQHVFDRHIFDDSFLVKVRTVWV
jgi:hypothetical protein